MEDTDHQFIRLSPELVHGSWDIIKEFLERADDDTATIEEIYSEVLFGKSIQDFWFYLVGGELKYVLYAYPQHATYMVGRVAGGGRHNPWPLIVSTLRERGKELGMSSVSFIGSKSWEKPLKGLNVKVTQYYYTTEIDDKGVA